VRFGVGQPLWRFEDARLLTGKGRYQDDVALPRQAYAVFVRSPHAHARIGAIDTEAAPRPPGRDATRAGIAPATSGRPMRPGKQHRHGASAALPRANGRADALPVAFALVRFLPSSHWVRGSFAAAVLTAAPF